MSPGLSPIGVAGCGAMGLPMARRLLAAGFETWGFDVRPAAEFGDFAGRMVADPADFAARCPTVLSVVRDARQTLDLLFDDQALFGGNVHPARLVVCSTLSPRLLPRIAERLPSGVALLDAPMSGAPYSAEAGTLTFMVGGPADAVADLRPAFAAMGSVTHHLGDTGRGMACKVLNNFVAAGSVALVRRALAGADGLGLDRARLLEVMRTSSGGTWYGNNLDRISWAREGYDAANTIGILEKDLAAYLDGIGRAGAPDALAAAVLETLRALGPLED